LRIKLALEFVQSGAIVAGNELVINMDRKHEEVVPPAARVETGVGLRWGQTLGLEPFVERFVEATRGLLQMSGLNSGQSTPGLAHRI
jgi:hypothetical protein